MTKESETLSKNDLVDLREKVKNGEHRRNMELRQCQHQNEVEKMEIMRRMAVDLVVNSKQLQKNKSMSSSTINDLMP